MYRANRLPRTLIYVLTSTIVLFLYGCVCVLTMGSLVWLLCHWLLMGSGFSEKAIREYTLEDVEDYTAHTLASQD